ncbi:MAG: hypothetical protein JSW51_06410 [Gemmatimonadota bacterium]|nr:MAG: hypothetical protein JSW51_06410 [Gemmatimonadota bacterium]
MNDVTRVLHEVRARLFRTAIFACVAGAVVTVSSSTDQSTPPDLIVVQVPASAEPPERDGDFIYSSPLDRYVDGARIVSVNGAGEATVLTADLVAACDPEISFDATAIIFAGKRTADDSWQIWRMDRDGSNKVQITSGAADNITPAVAGGRFYLDDPQPTPQIVFASTAHGWANEEGGGPAFALYGTDQSGETLHRLTFNLNSDLAPDVLPTGRIVFTSWQHSDHRASSGGYALMEINIDGTDLMPFYGNHQTPRFKWMAHVSDHDERVYFIEADQPAWLGGGDIAYVSRRRPLNSYQKLSQTADGYYHSPVALPGGGLAASYRTATPDAVFGIYELDRESGQRQRLIFEESGWHSIDAQVIVSRPPVKGRSNWLIPGTTTGVFYALDTYRTNLDDGNSVEPGDIKHVRVIEGVPRHSSEAISEYVQRLYWDHGSTVDSSGGARRLLGIAPVAPDGSFHIRVPAETPVTFQLLDENYMSLRTQLAWTWVIGNENRGCIGCHEDRELSPPNKMTQAIVKPPVELTLPPQRRRTVDFRHQVAPIIESRCTTSGCHGADQAGPQLAGTADGLDEANRVYRTLLSGIEGRNGERLVVPGKAKESPLIWLLFGRNMGSGQTRYSRDVTQMPPHDMLRPRERILLIEWIDLGALWDARAAVENQAPER